MEDWEGFKRRIQAICAKGDEKRWIEARVDYTPFSTPETDRVTVTGVHHCFGKYYNDWALLDIELGHIPPCYWHGATGILCSIVEGPFTSWETVKKRLHAAVEFLERWEN